MAYNPEKISKDAMEGKINNFGQILQKFGLDLIQTIGEMKHTLNILNEKVEKIDIELIELKGLKNQLQEIAKFRSEILDEIGNLKSMNNTISLKINAISSKTEFSTTHKKKLETPNDVLEDFDNNLKQASSLHELMDSIKKAKEQLYILTGGHKILFELSSYERKLKPNNNFDDLEQQDFTKNLQQKIKEWKKIL